MKRDMQSYQVVILGDTYTIATDEPEEHVVACANLVHTLMQEFVEKASHVPHKTVAICAALKLASMVIEHEGALKHHQVVHTQLVDLLDSSVQHLRS